MSGAATFSGTTYQARVIAHVYVHILAQARLGWLEFFDDTPIGVSAETDGPGDDARIEFGERHAPIETQAKHGLTAGAKLSAAFARVRERSSSADCTEIVFVVDRTSSRTVHHEVAGDLQRFRVGREDGLRSEFLRLKSELGADSEILRRISIVTADLDAAKDPEVKISTQLLESILEERGNAPAAWALLTSDAADICAKKLRRTRKELVDLLQSANIKVRLPAPDERVARQLDLSKRLLNDAKAAAALAVLSILDADLKGKTAEPAIRYRLAQHHAAALLMLGKPADALTAARLALDFQPNGVPALLTAAYAAAESGELGSAHSFISRALASDEENAEAWAAKTQIEAFSAKPITEPPAAVAETATYQLALAQVASNAFDWNRVAEVTEALLTRGNRDPKLLQLRVSALIGMNDGVETPEAEGLRADAERLATEAIETLPEESPLASTVLVLRAEIRHLRGDAAGSEDDLRRAAELNGRDMDAVAHRAVAQLHAGRPEVALQMLQIASVEEHPMLLALRAQARTETSDAEGARRDLDAAIAHADEAWRPDAVRILCAETAIALHDADRADQLLSSITSESVAPEMQAALRGRAAFERRDADAMQCEFKTAAGLAPRLKPRLYAELASRLLRLGETTAAVAIFDEIGVQSLPPQLHQHYASALMETRDFSRAARLVEELCKSMTPPEWALSVAAEIAARQGDAARAVELLKEIAARRPDDVNVQLELSRRLLLIGEATAALPYLDALLSRSGSLEAQQRMGLAYLLKEAGRDDDAVQQGFSAFRSAPQDPAMHRGFGYLLLTDPPLVGHSGTVTDHTYVRLASHEGEKREYVIYGDGPIDPLRHEISLDEAQRLGLTDAREGDELTSRLGGWNDTKWKVEEILPAVVFVWRDVVAHFQERFPSEPFFVHVVKMADENSVKYLAPIISTLQARKDRAQEVLRIYRENTLPLGFVAAMLGGSIPDVMATLTTHEDEPLPVEWFDAEGQAESMAAAREASTVVLTRSALVTLQSLNLLDTIAGSYEWWVPKSLVESLRHELEEAEKHLSEGQKSMMATEAGVQIIELDAGDARLKARVDRIRDVVTWTKANTKVQYRPLEKLGACDPREDDARPTIGRDSADTVELAEHYATAMLADDLGLRRFLPKGSPGRSFSTVTFLARLAERNVISADEATDALLKLVEQRYVVIVPTRALLMAAIRKSRDTPGIIGRAFALLAGPALDVSSAAAIAAETIRAAITSPVQLVDVASLTRITLEALAMRWPPPLSAYALLTAAASEFMLLPTALKTVRRVTTAFVQRRK
jgi:predicted Zn-dependent protease